MAKDPAILWYYQDYLSGTEHMSFSEQGAYARLLNKQADIGHFTLQFAESILKKDFKKLWPAIKGKFLTDGEGLFYNERMDIEVAKRRKHSQKQTENVLKRWNKIGIDSGNTMVIPLENENVNTGILGDSLKGDNITPYVSGIGLLPRMLSVYKTHYPAYPEDEANDYPALLDIAQKIAKYLKIPKDKVLTDHAELIEMRWGELSAFAEQDEGWFATKSIQFLNKHFQDFLQKFLKHTPVKNESRSSEIQESVREKHDRINRESVTGPIR